MSNQPITTYVQVQYFLVRVQNNISGESHLRSWDQEMGLDYDVDVNKTSVHDLEEKAREVLVFFFSWRNFCGDQ
jgi:plasmid rolling circle replication initiator protein Rep